MVESGTRRSGMSIVCLGVVFALGACAPHAPSGPTVAQRDSAGIRLVEITGDLRPLGWTVEPGFMLGGRDEGPESFYQVKEALITVGSAGDIHVLDAVHRRIVTFSSTGDFVGSVGREGDGPGELGQPFAFGLSPDGDFVVADRRRRGLVRLTDAGEPRPAIEVDAPIFAASGVDMAGVTPVFTMFRWTGPAAGVESLLWGTSERELATAEVQGPNGSGFPSCPGGFVGLPFLDRGLLWSAFRQGVVVSPSLEYEVRVFEGGELTTIIRRDVTRQAVTREGIAAYVGYAFEARTGRSICSVLADEAIRIKDHLASVPAITALARSDDGRIWVRRGALPLSEGTIDVYDADGTPLGTLPPGTPFPIAFTPGGIASVVEDDLGVQRLGVYLVQERE